MRRRRLGERGPETSELGLGTWGLSGDGYGPVPEAEQDRVIDRALAVGISCFDTGSVNGCSLVPEPPARIMPRRIDGFPCPLSSFLLLGTNRAAVHATRLSYQSFNRALRA